MTLFDKGVLTSRCNAQLPCSLAVLNTPCGPISTNQPCYCRFMYIETSCNDTLVYTRVYEANNYKPPLLGQPWHFIG